MPSFGHLRGALAALAAAALLVGGALTPKSAEAQERVLGEETIGPGIHLVFEAAPKDDVTPYGQHLAEDKTDVHIEVLTTWATDESVAVPEGATRGGFVGYLHFFATITNEATGAAETIELVPHVTLGDAMHYARNVSLPGSPDDPYSVTFDVQPPSERELAFHESWREAHGQPLFEASTFTYEGLDLAEVAAATRP
ncbi:MAG: iron transporter [Salinibacter sp.]